MTKEIVQHKKTAKKKPTLTLKEKRQKKDQKKQEKSK